jgi:hypothetical protein
MYYTDRAAFEAAAPQLSVDRFATPYAFPPYPNLVFHTRPVSAATNDALFPAGCILPGLSITTAAPVFESQAIKCESDGPGVMSVGTGTFEDLLILDFSPPVAAVGTDVFGHVYPGPVFPGHVEVTTYNGATEMGFIDQTLPSVGHGFVGITAPQATISRVTFLFVPAADRDSNTLVTALEFGTPGAAACYANCDGSTASPVLNVLDFTCFMSRFAAGDSFANCDGSTAAPVLNVLDFVCFMDRFAAGCP